MSRFLRDNSLALAVFAFFLLSVIGQSVAGWQQFNHEQIADSARTMGWLRYLVSSDFHAAVMENWQSEFLQISAYTLFTVWFRQRGSAESRDPDEPEHSSDEKERLGRYIQPDSPKWAKAGGFKTRIYSNSLVIAMGLLFALSWLAQALTQRNVYNHEQHLNDEALLGFWDFIGTPYFWERTLENWQSEFLAVGMLGVATIYLRQSGSTESKPVGAPHAETGA